MRINQARQEHEAGDKKDKPFLPSITVNDVDIPRKAHAVTKAHMKEVSDLETQAWTRRADLCRTSWGTAWWTFRSSC
jgi:hypothetical protein